MARRPVTSPTQPTPCEACEAPIFFATAPSGSSIPVDAATRADGSAALRCDRTGSWRARILTSGDQLAPGEKKHMPHWVTCPRADDFRKRDRAAAARAGQPTLRPGFAVPAAEKSPSLDDQTPLF
jgi:hypothetical protein